MNLRLNSRVVSISPDPPAPHVVLASGEVVRGDMIIGADGVRSTIRTCLAQGPDEPTPTGDAAYRVTISTEGMLKDPELKPLVDNAEATFWLGPERHVVGYCMVRGLVVRMVCSSVLTFSGLAREERVQYCHAASR